MAESVSSRRTSTYLVAGQLFTAGVSFLVNILAANAMPPEDRGALAFAIQLCYTLTILSMMGLERPFIAASKGEFAELLIRFVGISRIGWLAGLLPLGMGVAFWLMGNHVLGLAGALIALYLVGNSIARAVRVAYIGSGDPRAFVVNTMASQAVLLAGAGTLSLAGVDWPLAWLALYVLMGLVSFATLWRSSSRTQSYSPLRKIEVRELRKQGLWLLPASFGNTAMLRSDRLLLPVLAGPAELGVYIAVAAVMEMASWPIQQWVDSSLRRWRSEALSPHDRRTVVVRAIVSVMATSVILSGAAFFVVQFALPESYRAAVGLIPILGVATVIYGWTRVQQGLLVARGQSGGVSLVETIGLVGSVAAYVLMIPAYGAYGAAWGSAIGYLLCGIAGLAVSARLRRTTRTEL